MINTDGRRTGSYARKKGKLGVEYYTDSATMAELYSRSYFLFPSIVYRNGFPQRIGFDESFGQVGDAIFLIRLAGLGTVVFLDEELFEYRTHARQDSAALFEDTYRLKDAFLTEQTKDDPRFRKKVARRVNRNQTRRWLERTVSTAIRKRSLRKAFDQLSTTRPTNFTIVGVYETILVPFRYVERIIHRHNM
jgi:hypothetical protein